MSCQSKNITKFKFKIQKKIIEKEKQSYFTFWHFSVEIHLSPAKTKSANTIHEYDLAPVLLFPASFSRKWA